ncbi:putative ribonuclease H-like domain-containing protein [Tanacetum coccineum]|uniref:Ribonuclease H-like domain-containing protein n=1 Tax=Tanacetum coccineum TaxID=301880 RepID=A0ABQ4WWU7_9ASTR
MLMMALTGVEQDDWSIEFDAEHMHFGQDGLDDFDWSNKVDDAPVSLALMATNSEVPYCSKCSKSYKKLLESYQTERDNFQRARTEILGYQMSLESLEVMLKTHEKNEYAWGDKGRSQGICYHDVMLLESMNRRQDKLSDFKRVQRIQESSRLSSCNLLEIQENQKGNKWLLMVVDLDHFNSFHELHSLSGNDIFVYSYEQGISEERSCCKKKLIVYEDQALHVSFVRLMQSMNLCKALIDAQKGLLLKGKRRIYCKGKSTYSDDDTPTGGVFSTNSFDDEEGGVADYNNLDPTIDVPSTPTLKFIRFQSSSLNYWQNALADESWVEAMQEELLQFKLQEVWVLCDLPEGKRVIGTKWVFRNKRDERGTIIKNKARLVAQGYRQEEGVDYDEVFAPVARIEAIRLFLAFASFMGFMSHIPTPHPPHQMDVKVHFCMQHHKKNSYMSNCSRLLSSCYPNKVYRVVKALYGLHQAPRAWYERLSLSFELHGSRRWGYDKTLFIKKDRRDIMLVQVCEVLLQKDIQDGVPSGELTFFLGFKSSNLMVPASTPIEAHKSLGKDEEGEDVDVHLYRSMIGCLMYLTASRPDIMFAVCLCARFQVTPKVSHLHAVKRIFRDIGYEGNLAQLTFSKPLFSPQWKYLVHVLLHCLSPKSTSWEQFGTNIASALVGLATNQKFKFLFVILTGMLGHIYKWYTVSYVSLGASSAKGSYKGTHSKCCSFSSAVILKVRSMLNVLLQLQMMLLLLFWKEKSDETEEVNIVEKEASKEKSGDIEE